MATALQRLGIPRDVPEEIEELAEKEKKSEKLEFSKEAQAVINSGKELWKYYHSQKSAKVNASYNDIRLFFQGTNYKGDMNSVSKDDTYNTLIKDLRKKRDLLAEQIIPKVYEYGFLLK